LRLARHPSEAHVYPLQLKTAPPGSQRPAQADFGTSDLVGAFSTAVLRPVGYAHLSPLL
jgi:hypothetical protein